MRPLISTQRNAARLGLEHEVGPDLRLDQHGEVGAPMRKKALHEGLIVERHILVEHALAAAARRASRAEVTVAVVSSMRISGRSAAIASITGSAALASPTLAAWNQARKPGGRGALARP